MAEENNSVAQQDQQQDASANAFQLERCYMKDASLEMPHAPEVFVTPLQQQPTVDMQFEVSLKKLDDAHREVTVRATVTIKAAENVMLIAEVKQAGISKFAALRMNKWLTSVMLFARPLFTRICVPMLLT